MKWSELKERVERELDLCGMDDVEIGCFDIEISEAIDLNVYFNIHYTGPVYLHVNDC